MLMKLVVAIVQNEEADNLLEALTAAHFGATRLASTGGFLRQGNTTIIVGVPDEAVQNVLNIVSQHGQGRRHSPVTNPFPDSTAVSPAKPALPLDPLDQILANTNQTTHATVFVLNLDRYERV